jgi:hypothetical protein
MGTMAARFGTRPASQAAIGPKALQLSSAAPWQDREDRTTGGQAERLAGGAPVGVRRKLVGQRVADERCRNTVALQELRLEGQQAEHVIASGPQHLDPARAPGPDGRRHVVHGTQTCPPGALLHAQVEVGRVDADVQVRRVRGQPPLEAPHHPADTRQVPDHLGKPHDRELLAGRPGLAAGGLHGRAGDAGKLHVGTAGAHGRDETRPEPVTRDLAGHDGNARH